MQGFNSTAVLLLVGGIALGTSGVLPSSSRDLCFPAGSVTYRLTATAKAADYGVAIAGGAARPDLLVGLVDHVERADFALADDDGGLAGAACTSAGHMKTVRIVAPGTPSDITIAITDDAAAADVTLYVHAARVGHHDAAALFAAIRYAEARNTGRFRDPGASGDTELEGARDEVAQLR